jgi:hypothetical protein
MAVTTTVDLQTAGNFAILGYSAITASNPSVIVGDVGLSPTTGSAITGITAVQVTGTIYAVDGSGPAGSVNNPGLLTIAKNDLDAAYLDAAGRTPTTTFSAGDNQLGGQTLNAGVYAFGHAATANVIGTLTLDAQGDPGAVFIFQASSDLKLASASVIQLVNGAQPCNVFWQVTSSATLGTGSTFVGNILALVSITDTGGSTVDGRLLARTAAVTVNNTHVTKQTCASPTPTTTPATTTTPGPTATPTDTSSSTSTSTTSSSASAAGPCETVNTAPPTIIEQKRIDPDSIYISWGPFSGVDSFNVQYGPTNGDWAYNTDVTGFSTTINSLPLNQPIWVRVAARSDCTIGAYGEAREVGETGAAATGVTTTGSQIPRLPDTGYGPKDSKNEVRKIVLGVLAAGCLMLVVKKTRRST